MADFNLGQLVWKITGDNSAFNKSYQESIKKLERFGKASTRIGRSLTTKLTLPLIGLGTAAVVTALTAYITAKYILILAGAVVVFAVLYFLFCLSLLEASRA